MEAVRLERLRQDLQQTLTDLRKLPGVTAAGIIRRDGVVIDGILPRSMNTKKLAAMAAAVVGTAEVATRELYDGVFQRSIMEAEGGKFISVGAGEGALLVALTKPTVNLGLTLMTMEEKASKVGEILAIS